MSTQQQIEQNAKEQYLKADANGKKTLEAIFGKDLFIIPLHQRINSFTNLCKEVDVKEKAYAPLGSGSYKEKADRFMERLMLWEEVFTKDNPINMADTNQLKYYPWHNIIPDKKVPAGFRLSFDACRYVFSNASLGVRPYFNTNIDATHVGKVALADYEGWAQNFQLHKNQLTNKK